MLSQPACIATAVCPRLWGSVWHVCVFVRATLFLCPLVADEGHSRFPVGVAGFFLNHHVTRAFQETGRAGRTSGISKLTALPSWQVPSCCVIFPEL